MKHKKLQPHQEDMLSAMLANERGIILSATGTGKTLPGAEACYSLIAHQTSLLTELGLSSQRPIIVLVKASRIGLTNQLATEYLEHLSYKIGNQISYDCFIAHSGESADLDIDEDLSDEDALEILKNLPFTSVKAFNSSFEISNRIKRAYELGKNTIIFTTYHSNKKVVDIISSLGMSVYLDINDEAHNLVSSKFSELLSYYHPERQYHFTATLKVGKSKEGRGMNNEELFGPIIYELSAKEAIDRGIIVPVKVTTIKSKVWNVSDGELNDSIGDLILKSSEEIEKEFPFLEPKLLVSVKGSRQIKALLKTNKKSGKFECNEFNLLLKKGFNILTVHSTPSLITHNGIKITRAQFEELKNELGSNQEKKLIIVHYDILSEGIDIPGLLGCLILRNMSISKFYQTIGRIMRVFRPNPSFKKHGLLMFPNINDPDLVAEFAERWEKLHEEGYLPEEEYSENLAVGSERPPGDDQFTDLENLLTKKRNLHLYIDPWGYGRMSDEELFSNI